MARTEKRRKIKRIKNLAKIRFAPQKIKCETTGTETVEMEIIRLPMCEVIKRLKRRKRNLEITLFSGLSKNGKRQSN